YAWFSRVAAAAGSSGHLLPVPGSRDQRADESGPTVGGGNPLYTDSPQCDGDHDEGAGQTYHQDGRGIQEVLPELLAGGKSRREFLFHAELVADERSERGGDTRFRTGIAPGGPGWRLPSQQYLAGSFQQLLGRVPSG